MLNETTKQEIRDKLAAISTALPNFRPRPAQRLMIAEVAKTLAHCPDPGSAAAAVPGKTVLVAEGGTGTGKSLAYSVAGLVMAKAKGKKLVISSSTVQLQEQLTTRDLPLFVKAGDFPVRVEIAKGRARYACIYRMGQALGDLQQLAMFGREERAGKTGGGETARIAIEEMMRDYAEGRWNGDRDLRERVDDMLWSSITTDRHGCINRACPHFSKCPQMEARKRIKDADVVVVNHDLLLADLALGGGKLLPAPEDAFLVLDEGHHFPEKAVSAFASSHFVNADRRTAEKLGALSGSIEDVLGESQRVLCDRIHDEAALLDESLGEIGAFFSSLAQLRVTEEFPRPTLEFVDSCIPEEFFAIGSNIRSLSESLCNLLDECLRHLTSLLNLDRSKHALIEKMLADAGFYKGRIGVINETWDLFLEEPPEGAPPVAKWIEASRNNKNHVDFQINASPVHAGGYLNAMLWSRAAGVVITSATLSTLGTFDDFLRRSGLFQHGVNCVALPSPFSYETQGVIEIPAGPNPKDGASHTNAVTETMQAEMDKQVGGEGMLVLFTSRKQMDEVVRRLPKALRKRVLVQGEQSKSAIIKEHCERIDGGSPSVIAGLASFTEGVDLAGRHCTVVLIAKLPFAVPDSPVLRTLSSWVERKGGDPFMEISVTDAARRMEQAVGRLIRTETDSGRIVVTDPRLWNTRYGRAILRGLPPFRVTAMGKEVKP